MSEKARMEPSKTYVEQIVNHKCGYVSYRHRHHCDKMRFSEEDKMYDSVHYIPELSLKIGLDTETYYKNRWANIYLNNRNVYAHRHYKR